MKQSQYSEHVPKTQQKNSKQLSMLLYDLYITLGTSWLKVDITIVFSFDSFILQNFILSGKYQNQI